MAGDRPPRPARAFAGRPGLAGQRRPAHPGRGRGAVDLCPPPRRSMAALRDPADLTARQSDAPTATARRAFAISAAARKQRQPIRVIFIVFFGESPILRSLDSWVRPGGGL